MSDSYDVERALESDEHVCRERFHVDLEPALQASLKHEAQHANMTVSDWVRYVLRADCDRRDRFAAARAGVS